MASRQVLPACLWFAVVAVTTAQDTPRPDPQQPTFRTTIQSVRVDLYATRDGTPVTDLRRDEIQLFEDNVPQTIQTFERISFTAPNGAPGDPRTLDDSRQLAMDPRSRLFVFFLTTRNTTFGTSPLIRDRFPLQQQINGLLGPNDLVAVMTPYMRIKDLTFDRRLPLNDGMWFADMENDPKIALWNTCFPPGTAGSPVPEMRARYQELMTLEALDSLIAHLGGLRDERKHVFVVSNGFRLYRRNPMLGARRNGGGIPGIPTPGGPPMGVLPRLGDAVGTAATTPRQCDADLLDLASLDHSSRLDEIAEHARRNNVTLHPISQAGLSTSARGRSFGRGGGGGGFGGGGGGGGATSSNTTRFEIEAALRGLAEDTDGVAIVNTNNIEGNLKKMMTSTSAYYLLSYSPTNGTPDGKFRRISVKVSRSNTRVRARPGYVALTPGEMRPLEPVAPSRPDPVSMAVNALTTNRTGDLHVRPSSWMRRDSSGSSTSALWVVAELDPQARSKGSWAKGGTAEMTLRPVGGGTAITRRVEVSPAGAVAEFEFNTETPLAPGSYSAQLEFVGHDGAPLGDFVRLTIPGEPAALGESVLSRRSAAPNQRFARTADPRFRRTEFVRIELPTTASEAATARLLDSKGSVLPVPPTLTERADASGAFRWIVVDVPMSPLAPASYVLEVTQGNTSRITAFRVIP